MRKKIFFSALIFFSCASKNPLNPENIIDIKIPLEWELSVSESINFSEIGGIILMTIILVYI